jgi:crossover junction endodeoxyribonuclease RusA
LIELWLPYPPSTNRLWRRARVGMIKSDEYVAWLLAAKAEVRRQNPGKISGKYLVAITAARPDKRKRDLGNLEKSVSDLLQSCGVIRDDCDAEMILLIWAKSGDGISVLLEPAGVE